MTALARAESDQVLDGRRGKVFCIRITDEDRQRLEALRTAAESKEMIPWLYDRRRGSLGGFIVWAALEYKPPGDKGPAATAVGLAGVKRGRRRAVASGRRRRRRGNTRKPPAPRKRATKRKGKRK